MENKDMKMGEESLTDEDLLSLPADNAQNTEEIDALSDTPVLSGADAVAEETEDATQIDDDFSLNAFSEYLQEDTSVEGELSEEKEEKKKQNTVLDYLHDLVFGLVAILLVFMLLFRGVVVSGSSMKDTFVDGDYIILLSNVLYRNPEPGDVIVASKDSFGNGEPIIKRVIATAGQEVDIDFETGIVYVDGIALDETYTKTPTNEPIYPHFDFPLVVDEGCVFVMGDNRNDSLDSRSYEIGQIDCREIMGKAIFLIIPGTDKGTAKRDFGRIGVLW